MSDLQEFQDLSRVVEHDIEDSEVTEDAEQRQPDAVRVFAHHLRIGREREDEEGDYGKATTASARAVRGSSTGDPLNRSTTARPSTIVPAVQTFTGRPSIDGSRPTPSTSIVEPRKALTVSDERLVKKKPTVNR